MHCSPRTEAPAPPVYACGPRARRFLKRTATKARRRSWTIEREVDAEAEVPGVPTARRLSDIEREIEVCYVQRESERPVYPDEDYAWDWEYHLDIDSLEYDAYVYDCVDDEEADLAAEAELRADELIHEYDRWLRRHVRCRRMDQKAKHRGRHYGRE